jgi:hypothetical protein
MLLVNHQIAIGSTTYTAKDRFHLIDLQATAALNIPVNHCRIRLTSPGHLTIAASDPVSVKLGYGSDAALVFTGMVESVEWQCDHVTVYGSGSFRALTVAHFNLLYEQSQAGEIVKDVTQRLDLAIARVDNGWKFPVYALGHQISAYDQLRVLADQCGLDFYATVEDKLVFARYNPARTHRFTYGDQILGATLDQPAPRITGVEVYGESPSSQGQGEQAYSWLTKKEVKGLAGSGSYRLQLDNPTARTQAIADNIAQTLLTRQQQKQRGQLKVVGAPQVQLGDAIAISKLPLDQQNGSFKVIGVIHRLNCYQGFYTLINWEQI